MSEVFLGIDPGLTGAIALLSDDLKIIRFYDTPVLTVKSGTKNRKQMNAPMIFEIFEEVRGLYGTDLFAVIEKVSPMPSTHEADKGAGMGVTSAFNYGKGVGIWLGLLAGCQIPFEEVHPRTWKSKMLSDMGKGKDASRVKAMSLFPAIAPQLQLIKHHGRADALLMAAYMRHTRGRPQPVARQVEQERTLFG
jgi:hypothetical protein